MADRRWTKIARDLSSHKLRTLLVVLSIAVGIFAVGVVMGARGVLVREFDAGYTQSDPPSATFTTQGLDTQLVRQVGRRGDIRFAEGRRRVTVRYTTAPDPGKGTAGWETMRLWAIPDFNAVRIQRIHRDTRGAWPPKAGEVLLERSAKQTGNYYVGQVLTVEGPAGKRTKLRVAGFVHDINAFPAQFTFAITGFVSMDSLGALGEPTDLNTLAIKLKAPEYTRAQASRVAADIRDNVLQPAGVTVLQTDVPKPGSHFLGDIFKALSLLLLALGVLSLALSGFLVVTTVSALMAQQTKQVGIMKAVGARTMQVVWMYLATVVLYGAMAVVIALPLSYIAGWYFTDFAAGILNFRVTDYTPPMWVFALEVGVGLIVPVLAALVPIAVGTRTPVVRALNFTGIGSDFGHGLIDRALGLVRGLPRPIALSLRNTFLRKGRLALTLITLALASAVVMSVLSTRASILQTVADMGAWWHYDAQAFLGQPAPEDVAKRAAEQVKGVTKVETWVESQAALKRPDGTENESVFAIGLPPDSPFITPTVVRGRWLRPTDTDAVVLNTDITKDEKWIDVGDTITLNTRGTKKQWRVVGIVTGQMMGPVAFAPQEALDEAISANGAITRVLVQTAEHTAESQRRTASELETKLDDAGLVVSDTQTQLRQSEQIASELGILVIFLVIMAGLLSLVGIIGLTGTMSINVLESTREIGVMRATGAGHGAIFGIFITEGVVVALMAWGFGAILSWPLSIWLVRALGTAMSIPLSYKFSFIGVGLWLASVLAIAVLASLVPSWNASRVSVRDAISYE